jgi:hypothetical protein
MTTDYRAKASTYHAEAYCQDCEFVNSNYLKAIDKAREHAIKTGHTVDVVKGYLLERERISDLYERVGLGILNNQ